MARPRCFRVNTPSVASETIDGEVIMIHLRTGCYYSTDKVGAEIWSRLEKGAPVDQIVDGLAEQYACDPTSAEEAVGRFLERLQSEDLVVPEPSVPEPSNGARAVAAPGSAPGGRAAAPPPLNPPVLQKYEDLQDLLLLDPIHDTDAAGWPVAKADRPGNDG
jgi:hypothetical protein